jgi:hypothetical protein
MHEDGTPLDAAEMEELVDDLEHLGTADAMDEIVAGKTWKSGVKVAFTADELARINNQPSLKKNDPSKEELTAMELTLLALEDGIARFHMVMKVKLTNPKGDMAMTVKGTVRVSAATGRPVEMSGTGPIEGSMQGMKLTGTATIATKAI